MNDWQMQNQLRGSPYSGCRCFTGWTTPQGPKILNNTSWPSPYGQGAIMCVDRTRKTLQNAPGSLLAPGPDRGHQSRAINARSGLPGRFFVTPATAAGAQNVQQVHFRPSRPYPTFVLAPGGDPLKPMPSAWTQKVGRVPYNLRALSFPSTTGAWNTRITGGISGNLPDAEICSVGQFSQHNLGLS